MKLYKTFKSATLILILLTAVLGVGYPLVVYGLGQLLFHKEAEGSLIQQGTHVI